MSTIIGIDPGLTGAAAVLEDGLFSAAFDMPVMASVGARKQVNCSALAQFINAWEPDHVCIEHVNAFPGEGVVGAFNFGQAFGSALGVVAALGIPYTLVRPATWKKALGLWKADKEQCRTRAIQLWPTVDLSRKKDHNRAEALLIARWCQLHGDHYAATQSASSQVRPELQREIRKTGG